MNLAQDSAICRLFNETHQCKIGQNIPVLSRHFSYFALATSINPCNSILGVIVQNDWMGMQTISFLWIYLADFSRFTQIHKTYLSFISHRCWYLEPSADIRTSSSLLKFKDSTRHYTSPGRQLPSVTTVAVSCFQIAYQELLNYMCLLKLHSISPTQTSTSLCRTQTGFLISVCLQPSAVGDRGE